MLSRRAEQAAYLQSGIEALLLVTVGPGARVVIPEPTFTLYALLTSILGGEIVRAPLGPELEYDAGALRRVRSDSGAGVTIAITNGLGRLAISATATQQQYTLNFLHNGTQRATVNFTVA